MHPLNTADISVGDKLPELRVMMTTQKIISAAAATRDWQPIHHDHDIAIKSGLRGIILNSPSQAGWI
jgi:acyl dehydratase